MKASSAEIKSANSKLEESKVQIKITKPNRQFWRVIGDTIKVALKDEFAATCQPPALHQTLQNHGLLSRLKPGQSSAMTLMQRRFSR